MGGLPELKPGQQRLHLVMGHGHGMAMAWPKVMGCVVRCGCQASPVLASLAMAWWWNPLRKLGRFLDTTVVFFDPNSIPSGY